MKQTFTVNVDTIQNTHLVKISGEVDVHSCSSLSETLESVVESAQQNIVLDLEDINYLDSSGLGTIAYSAKLLSDKNYDMMIVCAKPQIKKIFELSGLSSKNIQLVESLDDIKLIARG